MTESPMGEAVQLSDDGFAVAERLARTWVQSDTDPNEVASVMAFVRDDILARGGDGERLFEYLDTVVENGGSVVRSGRTIGYYKRIRSACKQHLRSYQDRPEVMAHILGWAVRLMRYYKVEDELEQPPERRRRRTTTPTPSERGRGAEGAEPSAPAEGERHSGRVKFFAADRGFGFIEPEKGDEDRFFHHSQLAGGLEKPAPGARVTYVLGKGPNGRTQAQDVRPA